MGIITFRICRSIVIDAWWRSISRSMFHHGEQRFALHCRWNWGSHFLQDRRCDVHQSHPSVDTHSSIALSRQLEKQWHVDGFVVEKNTVVMFAVLPERFPVVGHD